MKEENTFGEIKKAIIGVIVLAITTAGGVIINKFIGGQEEPTLPIEQPQVIINLPEQKVEKDTVVKVVKVKPPIKKVEKEEAIDW